MTQSASRKSDLGVRVVSAVVMMAVAGATLWLGGWLWIVFVAIVALGVLREWQALTRAFADQITGRTLWTVAGIAYIGIAAGMIGYLRSDFGVATVLWILLAVIAVDVGAYFAGRAIGGPKIAPAISPSKTWAGLGGGIVAASVVFMASATIPQYLTPATITNVNTGQTSLAPPFFDWWPLVRESTLGGTILAVVAQAGDFFESWMKRKASVKDSGALIPGHGGLFDRMDGLLAVLFVFGVIAIFGLLTRAAQ
ncbi:MAG: phosphatidate cytidylyltransferase [Novosphingobium sp.]|nr:phosphatidate cytidylyltransferase [Novosphingobium sp.]